MFRSPIVRRLFRVTLILSLLQVLGCGGLKTYPVKGKVVFEKGDVGRLRGNSVELVDKNKPEIRPFGTIESDGSFTLQTRFEGKSRSGAPEGDYLARICLVGDESEDVLFRKVGVDPRYLDFKASGFLFKVPSESEVVLKVTPAKPGAKLVTTPKPPSSSCDCK